MFLCLTYRSFWLAKGNISMPLSFHEHMAKIRHLSRVVNRVFHSAWYATSSCFFAHSVRSVMFCKVAPDIRRKTNQNKISLAATLLPLCKYTEKNCFRTFYNILQQWTPVFPYEFAPIHSRGGWGGGNLMFQW